MLRLDEAWYETHSPSSLEAEPLSMPRRNTITVADESFVKSTTLTAAAVADIEEVKVVHGAVVVVVGLRVGRRGHGYGCLTTLTARSILHV